MVKDINIFIKLKKKWEEVNLPLQKKIVFQTISLFQPKTSREDCMEFKNDFTRRKEVKIEFTIEEFLEKKLA